MCAWTGEGAVVAIVPPISLRGSYSSTFFTWKYRVVTKAGSLASERPSSDATRSRGVRRKNWHQRRARYTRPSNTYVTLLELFALRLAVMVRFLTPFVRPGPNWIASA